MDLARAREVAGAVPDPELPMLTLADLGVLRSVEQSESGSVVVTITPTFTGCPATATIRADVRLALDRAGFNPVEVRTALSPPWTSSWISAAGREALQAHGIAPPGGRTAGPVDLPLVARPACPRCGSRDTRQVSAFGPTPCTSMHRCRACLEPFDEVKDL